MTFVIGSFQFISKSEDKYSEIKSCRKCTYLTVFFLIYEVVHYLNNF